jgi:Protein of unknown function (DUF3500)
MGGVSLAAEMASAADSWLASLSADQRAVAAYPGPDTDDRERTTWFYTPTDHGGLTLNQQRPGQQQLAMRLLAAGLSVEGYALAAIVMGLENIVDRLESWTRDWGRERGRDPGAYYFRVFGSPGDGTWGWRCGGHHLSVNYTIVDGRVASCTPCFIGAQPAHLSLLAGGTLRPLGDLESAGRQLALDLDQRSQPVVLHRSAISDIVSGNRARVLDGNEMIHMQDLWRARFTDERLGALVDEVDATGEAASGYGSEDHRVLAITARPKGVPGSALTPAEQARLLGLVEAYMRRFPAEIADPWLAAYQAGDALAGLHFAYAGEPSRQGPAYYRLQDRRLLVEYDNTQSGANHAHSVVRDLTADFGMDALAVHRRAYH